MFSELFYFDQNNILKTNKPLKVSQRKQGSTNRKRSVYRLLIEVEDSGFPIPLKSLSALSLNVVVIKEGEYAPQLTPHQVEVILTPGKFQHVSVSVSFQIFQTELSSNACFLCKNNIEILIRIFNVKLNLKTFPRIEERLERLRVVTEIAYYFECSVVKVGTFTTTLEHANNVLSDLFCLSFSFDLTYHFRIT